MDDASRPPAVFFEVFEGLPRQGPGCRACTARALALCAELPARPLIVDLGCGTGAQTLDLADLIDGSIVAVELHAPSVDRLRAAAAARGLADRIDARAGDMAAVDIEPGSVDLVWSEGALYNIGLPAGLRLARRLLRPGGYVAFTEAVWLSDDRPPAAREAFADYPGMGTVADVRATLEAEGFERVDDFVLPEAAWWDDFYGPMERRVATLRAQYADDAAALETLAAFDDEVALRRAHGASFGYAFFVARPR